MWPAPMQGRMRSDEHALRLHLRFFSQIRQIQRAARTLFTEDSTPLPPFHKRGRQYVLRVTDDVAVESLSSHRPATKSLGQG